MSYDLAKSTTFIQTVVVLSDSLTPRGVVQWLHAENRSLNGRIPVDLLEAEPMAVIGAATSFVNGDYV